MVNLTRCLVYWDGSSVTQCLGGIITVQEKQTNTVVLVGLWSPRTVPNLPVMTGLLHLSTWVFRGVIPVCHKNLKTYRTDYRERCRKTIPRRVDRAGRY